MMIQRVNRIMAAVFLISAIAIGIMWMASVCTRDHRYAFGDVGFKFCSHRAVFEYQGLYEYGPFLKTLPFPYIDIWGLKLTFDTASVQPAQPAKYPICNIRGEIPFWFAIVGLLLQPLSMLAIMRLRKDKRRLNSNFCQICYYDLTGNESGVCPECGEPLGASA